VRSGEISVSPWGRMPSFGSVDAAGAAVAAGFAVSGALEHPAASVTANKIGK
jgi:hypothetical protein